MGRLTGWVRSRPAESWIGAAVVLGSMVFVLAQLHPGLLVRDSTPAGGDMGAHVWGPAYLRDHLLPSGRLTGWSPDWYAGFPAFHFYMLPPALLIVLLDTVLAYGVAMKLVTVAGVVAMPAAAYAFARLLRLPFPGPPLLAVAATAFLFERSWTIYGGNVASTLAGEYSFSISLPLALIFFGLLARGLDEGRHRGAAAAVLALTILCHAIPAFFAMAGGLLLVVLHRDFRGRLAFAAPVLAVGALLTSFWSVPFVLRREYLTDMGWERLETYGENLFPADMRWVLVLAAVGIVVSFVRRERIGLFLGLVAIASGLAFRLDALSFVHIWNARILPFYYLAVYLLAGVAAALLLRALAARLREPASGPVLVGGAVAVVLATFVVVGLPLRTLPGGSTDSDGTYRWAFLETKDKSFVGDWARWNYSGYEGKEAYPEYRGLVETMRAVGEERGCGRAHWEYESELDRYGTPMALMLLPYWTDGCIGSMEGLYFESSATTPFHFLNASEVSAAPSNPVRSLPDRPIAYRALDLDVGIPHLRMLGVRYYLAFSEQAVTAASGRDDLREVASSGPWTVYEIEDASIVEPLANEPVVGTHLDMANPGWQREAIAWYSDPERWDVHLAADGPDEWRRVGSGEPVPVRPVAPVQVRDVREGTHSVSFSVDRVGEPVLVKVSYFPNWRVSGADGPYRVTPNLMVVVPTERDVRLTYGNTWVEYAGWLLTLLALAGLVWLVRRGRVQFDDPLPPPDGAAEADEADGGPGDAPEEGRPSRPPLLDVDGQLGDGQPSVLRP